MKEFLYSDEFREYSKLQLEAIVDRIGDVQGRNPDVIYGSLQMAKALMDLPFKILAELGENKTELKKMLEAAHDEFQVKFVRRHLKSE